jgi:hypothetical protein
MKRAVVIALSVVFLAMVASDATGQTTEPRYSAVWTSVSLVDALPELARMTGIDLIYDEETVRNRIGHCAIKLVTAEEMLRCLVQSAGLDFVRTSAGTYLVILPAAKPPRRGSLAGRVTDARSGQPLPYANIMLADAQIGAAAGSNGEFIMADLLPGPHRIIVTYVGYQTSVLGDVDLQPGEVKRVEVELEPSQIVVEAIIVDGLQQRLSQSLVEHALDPRTTPLTGLEGTDIMRAATAVQGVTTYRSLADLHVQGGAMGEHVTLLDGTPVRDPVSFGRYLGAFSPLAIGGMTVHKSGFGAREGSHLAGVLSLSHDVDTPGAAVHVDPVSVNARFAGRTTTRNRIDIEAMAAARSSIWRHYQSPDMYELLTDWTQIDPVLSSMWLGSATSDSRYEVGTLHPRVAFSDVHAALRVRSQTHSTLTASVFRADNRIANAITARQVGYSGPNLSIADDYEWTNWAAHARYQRLIGSRTFAALRLSASDHTSGYEYHATYDYGMDDAYAADVEMPPSDERHHIREWTADLESTHVLMPRHTLDVGFGLRIVDAAIRAANPFIASIGYEDRTWLYSGHATSTLSLGMRTTLELGTRATYVAARQTLYAEPRISARYDAGGYALRLSGGLYRQFLNQFELSSPGASSAIPSMLFWLPSDRSMAPPRAIHVAADALFVPPGPFVVQVEGYYKDLSRLLALDYEVLAQEEGTEHTALSAAQEFVEAGRGYATGIGLRLRHETSRIRSQASYSFSRSRRAFSSRLGGRMETVPWEEPHRLTLDSRLRVARGLDVRAVWQMARGRTWGFRRAYYDYVPHAASGAPVSKELVSRPQDHVLPPFERLDVALMLTRSVGGSRIEASLALLNVLDRSNMFDLSLAPGGSPGSGRHLPGRQPAFSVTVRR